MKQRELLSISLSRKLAELKSCSYEALHSLPKHSETPILGVKAAGLLVQVDDDQEQSLKISVQAYKSYFLGFGISELGGFRISKGGVLTDLRPDELE